MRIGRIAYTNVVPVYAGFDTGAIACPGRIVSATPAVLNARMAAGELDVSPVSAAYYLRNAHDLVLVPDLCIGSRTEVMSVLLASTDSLAGLDGRRVAVTAESASGRALLEMLLRRENARVTFEPVSDALASARGGVPTLLIGERALDARDLVPPEAIHDLGTAWHTWTGGDMVFAVWVARASVAREQAEALAAVHDALVASLAWSSAHPDETTALARGIAKRPASLYARYFRTLNYVLDAPAQAGLRRFASELASLDGYALPEVLRVAR